MKLWIPGRKRINLDKNNRTMIELKGRTVPLRIRRHARARSLILRLEDDGSGAIVTVPYGVRYAEAVDLAESRADWILDHLDSWLPRIPFEAGAVIPVLGVDHWVCHNPWKRGVVWREGREIHVSGKLEHLPRRLHDWFYAEARLEITARAKEKAARIGEKVGRITIRDMRSRWGSCGENGAMAFTWRLLLAPEHVLDYVVSHEVAHLKHLDHSARFWEVATSLTAGDVGAAQAWLDSNGNSLYRYG